MGHAGYGRLSPAIVPAWEAPLPPPPRPSVFHLPQAPRGAWKEVLWSLGIAVGLAMGCHVAVAEARYIPSRSMVPTLAVGDRVVVEKLSYWLTPPRRGDIVVFRPPPAVAAMGFLDTSVPWIKRVVGLPGEHIAIRQGWVHVNGRPLAEPYLGEAPAYELAPVEVPARHVFVLGDNRNHSIDSHVWGAVPFERVLGRAGYRFWPLTRWGDLAEARPAMASSGP